MSTNKQKPKIHIDIALKIIFMWVSNLDRILYKAPFYEWLIVIVSNIIIAKKIDVQF